SFLYRQLIRTLQGTFRCIAVDYLGFGLFDRPPGYGYTPAEHAGVVGELVRELDLKELIVMGHDWGGPIGFSVAPADPERIAGLGRDGDRDRDDRDQRSDQPSSVSETSHSLT